MKTGSTEEAPPPLLALRLLGGFSATICNSGDQTSASPLPPVRGRTTIFLLTLLALSAPRPVSREFLRETLWPDSSPEASSQNLRRALADLRMALGPAAMCLSAPSPRTLALDTSKAECDVLAFDRAVQSGDSEHALACYGGPLLPECSELWILAERETRHHAYLAALENCIRAEAGTASRVPLLRRLLAEDPLRETAARALMTDLAALGDPAGAANVFRTLRACLLEARLGPPQSETETLYRTLMRREKEKAAGASVALPLPKTSSLSLGSGAAVPIPLPLNRLIGRDEAVYEIARRLSTSRLVTLVGSGGVGKTRLSQEVAREVAANFANGVWFIDLAPITNEANSVLEAGAKGLGIELTGAHRAAHSLEAALKEALASRSLLLLLDNCEHVIEAVAVLAQGLLTTCADVRILATSRQPLNLTAETIWRVPSLVSSDAITLFNERASQADTSFVPTPEVEEVCRRLDGIPLALELAAARLRHLSLSEIADRLQDRFALLTNGERAALPRHRTLRALTEWSWELLTEEEQTLLGRLSVFAGGWNVAAADAIYGFSSLDTLAALVDKSLVVHEGGGRYRLLETIRQFAAERLQERGETTLAARLHSIFYLSLAEEGSRLIYGPEHQQIVQRLSDDDDNLRATLAFFREENEDNGAAQIRMAGALWRLWYSRGQFAQAREWLCNALAASEVSEDAEPQQQQRYRGRACYGLGHIELDMGNIAAAEQRFHEARTAFLAANSVRGVSHAYHGAGRVAQARGDARGACTLFQEALRIAESEHDYSDEHYQALLLSCIAQAAKEAGETTNAEHYARAALVVYRQIGHASGISRALGQLGNILLEQGKTTEAGTCLTEALAAADNAEDSQNRGWALLYLSKLAVVRGEQDKARGLLTDCLCEAQQRREEPLAEAARKALAKLANKPTFKDE